MLIDFDVGLRNLDLVMGAERRVVYDLVNVTQGVAKLSQALIRDKRIETLFLLPASQTRDKDALTEQGVAKVIAALREKFDYVLCDSPAGHRARRAACHAFRRRRGDRDQSRGQLVREIPTGSSASWIPRRSRPSAAKPSASTSSSRATTRAGRRAARC